MISFLLVIATILQSSHGWFNQYDQPFTFMCPQHQYISRIHSIHDNHREDRVFDFQCKPFPLGDSENCSESVYANDFDQPEVFQCPHAAAITGISSIHSNHDEDRRYKFFCCEGKGMCMSNCEYSGFVNSYDRELDYTVKDGYVLRGITSIHSNRYEY